MIRLIGAGARPGHARTVRTTLWTAPNMLTIARFLCVPWFVWLIISDAYAGAVVVLVLLGSTDWIDGYIARRFNQESTVGTWMDPVADRAALIVVAATFVVDGVAPAWLIWTIVIPDVILIANALILFHGPLHLPVSNVGKVRTALLLLGAPLLLLQRVPGFEASWLGIAATTILAVGCVGHLIAFYGYFVAAHRKYRDERRAGEFPAPMRQESAGGS